MDVDVDACGHSHTVSGGIFRHYFLLYTQMHTHKLTKCIFHKSSYVCMSLINKIY